MQIHRGNSLSRIPLSGLSARLTSHSTYRLAIPAFDDRHIAIASRLAKDIATTLLPDWKDETDPKWKEAGFGY